MNIKMFKIITGDVIMGDVNNELEGSVVVNKPAQLVMDPTQMGVGIIPYDAVFTQQEQEEVSFKSEHIIHYMPVAKAFEDSYIQFRTGVEVANG